MSKIDKFATKLVATVDEFASKMAGQTGLDEQVIRDQVIKAVRAELDVADSEVEADGPFGNEIAVADAEVA